MRCPIRITAGLVASALILAACDGPQVSTAPNETPSFAKISPQIQYAATLTCNAAASNSYALAIFDGVSSTYLFCSPTGRDQVTGTSFEIFDWAIALKDFTGRTVKNCPRKGSMGTTTHTGQFTCKDVKTGLSAVLTIKPS